MAENLESLNSFGIENTIEMGVGSAELIKDLLSPETSTGDPDSIKPIIEEVAPPPPAPKAKTEPPKEESSTPEQNIISSFLDEGEESEEPEEPVVTKTEEPVESNESVITALSNDLFKLGVFSLDDGEETPVINTHEEFLERFNSEKKKGAIEIVNNFIGQFGEDYQQAFDAIFVKGVDPKNYFNTYNNITSFAELDLTNEDNQVTVLRKALTDQGFEPDDINTEIDRLRNYGDLESVAIKHHKVLVRKEAAKLQQMEAQAEKELQQKAAMKNQYVQNVQTVLQEKLKNKEFDGIPINPKLANELQDFLLVDKYKTASGETLTDFDRTILELKRPENHAMKVKVALLLKILEKDPTLSTIQKNAVTKKSDQLFGEVARQVTKAKTNPQKPNSWFL